MLTSKLGVINPPYHPLSPKYFCATRKYAESEPLSLIAKNIGFGNKGTRNYTMKLTKFFG